jgi:serine/threonine-protein kinase
MFLGLSLLYSVEMTIEPGQLLLHYRLTEQIGEGGMGVVWKARDTSLDRDVAIKLLPANFADDAERLSRFEREAKLLASLDHPNIASIHGLHEAEGSRFLAMELVDGEDLSSRLERGAMPVEEALEVARQVAEALEAAHDNGVVHRDLKPANVQLRSDGKIKVLDFGLAKTMDAAATSGDSAASPTITSLGTVAGVILGTAAYMSPEQARGHSTDRRADIWSFGAMLFELLSGHRPFEGETISDTLAAVLRAEPDWKRLPEKLPVSMIRLLKRCLTKDPRRRLQSIGEARVRLEEVLAGEIDEAVSVVASAERSSSKLPWVVAGVALLIGVASLGAIWLRPSAPTVSIRSEIGLIPPAGGEMSSFRLLNRGSRFVYSSRRSDVFQLRDLGQVESTGLMGTEEATLGDISPDGEWLAFFSDESLLKIPIDGGVAQELTKVANSARGASWGSDGYIYYAPSTSSGIWRVPQDGGRGETVTQLPEEGVGDDARINTHRWPTALPGGRGLIYTAGTSGSFGDARIELLDFASGKTQVLQRQALYSEYLPGGYLTFVHAGALTVMGFDAETLRVTSAPKVVVEGVEHSLGNAGAQYSLSDDGTLLYRPGKGSQVDIEMQLVGREGQRVTLRGPTALFHPRYSPEGDRIVFSEGFGVTSDVWIHDLTNDVTTRLTFDSNAADVVPIWSPDGKWITFSSDRDHGVANLFRKRADGSGEIQQLTIGDAAKHPCGWSSDGRRLLYIQRHAMHSFELMLKEFDENGLAVGDAVRVVEGSAISTSHGMFSPDDNFIAYEIRERGVDQLFITSAEGEGRWQLPTEMGRNPRWSKDGRRLYFSRDDDDGSEIAFVEVSASGGGLTFGQPQVYARLPISRVQAISSSFDVHPDEQQLVVMAAMWSLRDLRNPILIQDWASELP